jgi:hypothetical protein
MIKKCNETTKRNIIDMAVSFSSMARVFKEGSIDDIEKKLYVDIKKFYSIKSKHEFNERHKNFCLWFTRTILTSKKKKNNSNHTSFGQAAKVLDIVLKVYFYYCHLPSKETSSRIIPWLNGAIDTKILEKIKSKSNKSFPAGVKSIADIDKETYEKLQEIINDKSNKSKKLPVEYEDALWRKLNKKE